MGTNRGSIHVMDSTKGCRVHELFFPGGNRRPVEIKDLAISSEEEVRMGGVSQDKFCQGFTNGKEGMHPHVQIWYDTAKLQTG